MARSDQFLRRLDEPKCAQQLPEESMDAGPFALNADGSAKSIAAFREALQKDADKLAALQKEPDVAAIILGGHDQAFQDLLKSVYRVRLLPSALVGYKPAGLALLRYKPPACSASGPLS